jgi:hypothetical protein
MDAALWGFPSPSSPNISFNIYNAPGGSGRDSYISKLTPKDFHEATGKWLGALTPRLLLASLGCCPVQGHLSPCPSFLPL